MIIGELYVGCQYLREGKIHVFIPSSYYSNSEDFQGIPLTEKDFLSLGFTPVCFTVWSRKEVFIRTKVDNPNLIELLYGSPRRKIKEIQYLHELQLFYKFLYGELLLL